MLIRYSLLLFIFCFSVVAVADDLGQVDFLIKNAGEGELPLKMQVGEKPVRPDAFGYATLALPGGDHQLNLFYKEKVDAIPFTVVAGERSQLIVNVFPEESAVDRLEAQKKKANKGVTGPREEVELVIKDLKGQPVGGAKVYVRGLEQSFRSKRNGLVAMTLPHGKHTFSVVHRKYATQMVRDIEVNNVTKIRRAVELTPSGLILDDFVVLAPNVKGSIEAMIEVRRQATSVADVMSAEQMSKTGDSDAAGSLRRVTGLTLKDGKYVYIRGLGERYSTTLMNGVALPSPDPSRRVIPLDLFPVQFLESMVIQKSFSPDQPGEFGGGVVMMKTKSMPEEFGFKASVSQTQNFNDGDLQSYRGGGSDWLGVDDGGRKIPVGIDQDLNQIFTVRTPEVSDQENLSLPDFNFTMGDSYKLRPLRVGYTLSGLYKDHITYEEEIRQRYNESETEGVLQREDDFLRPKTNRERTVGGIAGLHFELFKNHSLDTNFLKIRNTTDYVANRIGRDEEGVRRSDLEVEWAARDLQTLMLDGKSKFESFNNLELGWHFSGSQARRDEPARFFISYFLQDDGSYKLNPADNRGYQVRYYDLQERADDRGLNASMPFPWFYSRKGKATLGINETRKNRVSRMRRFGFDPSGDPCNADLSGSIGSVLSTCQSSFVPIERTRNTDRYNAEQSLRAYYFRSEWPLLRSLKLNTGVRLEESVQTVGTITDLSAQPIVSELTTRNLLPGSSLTYKINKKMQVRMAYSETISRPDLRELSDTLWEDFDTGFDIQGNPSLKATVIKSYDARWEWYFSQRENISFGVFRKDFDNPIEQVFTGGSAPRISFFNVERAELLGAEIELSKNLGFMTSWLRRFTFSANYAALFSNVQLGDLQNAQLRDSERPLQGQSDYMLNILLDYQHEPLRMNGSLSYNVYGKRIAYTGSERLPDVWELPFHQLDFVFSKGISKTASIKMKLRNILDPPLRFEQGGQTWRQLRRGRELSLGLSMEI